MTHECTVPGCPKTHRWKHRSPAANRQRAGSGWAWQRVVRTVLERDGFVCQWCGGRAVTADHVLAVAQGGTDELSNLVSACTSCNMRRAHQLQVSVQRSRSRLRPSTPHPGYVS